MLGPAEARKREPSLRPDISGGVFWAEDAHCEPGLFVTALARAAERRGVRFEFGLRVTRLTETQDGAIAAVRTERGAFRPRKVVLAAGAWTPALAQMAGVRIPLEAGKGYHVQLHDGAPQLRMPLIFQESVFAATPMGGTLRLAGTMEFVGLDPRLGRAACAKAAQRGTLLPRGPRGVWPARDVVRPPALHARQPSHCRPKRAGAEPPLCHGPRDARHHARSATGRALADLALDGRCELPIEPLSPIRYRA